MIAGLAIGFLAGVAALLALQWLCVCRARGKWVSPFKVSYMDSDRFLSEIARRDGWARHLPAGGLPNLQPEDKEAFL